MIFSALSSFALPVPSMYHTSSKLMWSHFNITKHFILAGHKCKFAADQPTPCPKDQFTSYLNQTTCQECDIGLGEKCYEHAKEAGSFITGQDHISDAIGSSLSYVKRCICQKYTLIDKRSLTRFKVAKCYEKELFKTTSKFT